ncbi:MAG: general secretion pathway protein GspK [bacterium]|nr:general secretion pathway protein GspK [bacterium]
MRSPHKGENSIGVSHKESMGALNQRWGKSSEGVALMMVLWVLLLLSFIALEFAHSIRTEVEVSKNFGDEIQAYYLARAGLELGRYELAICGDLSPHYRDLDTGELIFGKSEDGGAKAAPTFRDFELAGGRCKYGFRAAGDKLGLNDLAKNENALKKFLEKYCGIEPLTEEMSMIAFSIMDWVDKDHTYQLPGIGAEDDWYESHDQGYRCKDAPFDNEDELSLIRQLRIEKGDSEEEIAKKKKIVATFKRYFGVYPELENIPSTRRALILNTASPEVIQVAYDIGLYPGLIPESPEVVQKTKEQNGGLYRDEPPPTFYYIISTAIMKASPVQRAIKASFINRRDPDKYWMPMYWNDNFIPEYSQDPNQTDGAGGADLDVAGN